MQLKTKDIKQYRQQQLLEQNNCCALCGEHILDDAVLDHDHKSGLVRKVLHRGCNALLGHIENNMPRNRVTVSRLSMITERLIEYITSQHTTILHSTYKTVEQRQLLQKKRAQRRRHAKSTTKRVKNP
jgi:hypothetical protein